MQQLHDRQAGFLDLVRAELSEYGLAPAMIRLNDQGLIEVEEHPLEMVPFVEQTQWSRPQLLLRAYTVDSGRLVLTALREQQEILRSNEVLEQELDIIEKQILTKLQNLTNLYYDSLQELHEHKTLAERIPEGLKNNLQLSETMAGVKTWQAKIILRNSAREGAPKVGELENVGYVHIGLNHGAIVPIARSDEHHRGYDVIHHLVEQGLIPEDTYHPLSPTSDYVDGNDARALQAMKVWRKLGGPNLIIKNSSGGENPFQVTMDDYILAEGNITLHKGELLPLGKGLLERFKVVAQLCISVRSEPNKEKQLYKEALKLYFYYQRNILVHYSDKDTTPEKIMAAQAAGGEAGIKQLEQLIFGFDGFKNQLHNDVRKALDPQCFSFERDRVLAIFGDLELAEHELAAL